MLALWKVADYKNKNGQDASKYLVRTAGSVAFQACTENTLRTAQRPSMTSLPQNGTIRPAAAEVGFLRACTKRTRSHDIALVWWSGDHTYKNAVTNELFLYLSANGYNRFGGQTYLDNAKKVRRICLSLFPQVDAVCRRGIGVSRLRVHWRDCFNRLSPSEELRNEKLRWLMERRVRCYRPQRGTQLIRSAA